MAAEEALLNDSFGVRPSGSKKMMLFLDAAFADLVDEHHDT